MTVASTQNRAGPFNGDGISTQFDFDIPYQKAADIRVLRRVLSTGVETQLAHLSDYSLASSGTGGRLTLASPLPTGHRLVVVRAPEPVQETDLIENDTYSAETLERALDYGIMVSARLADLLSRALVLPETEVFGLGAYNAAGNRVANAGLAINPNDLTTLAQVQAIVADGGGSGGGAPPPPPGWPALPVPGDVQTAINSGILSSAEFQATFAPINFQIGALSTQLNAQIAAVAAQSAGLVETLEGQTAAQIGNLANQIIAQNATISTFSTSLGTINTTLTAQQLAIDLLEQLQGDGTEIVALITTETNQRIDGDSAIATLISKIGAADGDGFSFLINASTAKIGASETLAQRFGSITAGLAGNTAAINTEVTARTTADTAFAQTIAKIGAASGDGISFLLNVDAVRVSPTETIAQRLSAIGVSINNATAAVSNETAARVSGDTSLATQISSLQSTIGGFSSAISTNATAINGVYAQYSVKVDNNGRVSGFGLISQPINGTIVSTFNFNSDVFNIWNGTSGVAPFTVSGGVVRMQNVEILGASIVSLNVNKIEGGTLGAQINVGAGRIIYDNGTVMRVQGSGFGTSNQFIDWYGLRTAGGDISLCSESNARWYLKVNGDPFYDGPVGAEVIKVSAATTNTLADASISIGPYSTPGGTKSIAVTYSFTRRYNWTFNNASVAGTAPTATVLIEKSTNGGSSWSTASTINVTGNVQAGPGGPETYADVTMSGSQTITDSEGATSNLMFRARMTARTLPSTSGTFTSTPTTQTINVTSTENI